MADDDSAKRVGWISHCISEEDLKPGDHIYCYGFLWKSYHGIYVGNSEVIHFTGDAKKSKSRFSAYLRKCILSEFLGGSYLRLVAYNESFVAKIYKNSPRACLSPAEKVVEKAEYYLNNPQRWDDYRLLFNNSETFAFHCKVEDNSADNSAQRVGWISHCISKEDVKPGDHIYRYGFLWIYSHHGIYVGKEDCEVIHFSGDAKSAKSSSRIRKCTLSEFLGRSELRLVAYSESFLRKFYKWKSSGHVLKCRPAEEVVETAEHYLKYPQEWKDYNLFTNNCETFACSCKAKWQPLNINGHLNGQGIGWGWVLKAEPDILG